MSESFVVYRTFSFQKKKTEVFGKKKQGFFVRSPVTDRMGQSSEAPASPRGLMPPQERVAAEWYFSR